MSSIKPKCVSLSDSDEARIGIVSKTIILDSKNVIPIKIIELRFINQFSNYINCPSLF